MIDVGELITDPDFATTFTVRRPTGTFANEGEFSSRYRDIPMTGIVQPAGAKEVASLPEGERITAAISVWCRAELSPGDGTRRVADVIIYREQSYRVLSVEPWGDAGYWRAVAGVYA